MSDTDKTKRCMFCHKLLIDEKIPVCKRCVLEGRDKVGKASAAVGAVTITLLAGKHFSDGDK